MVFQTFDTVYSVIHSEKTEGNMTVYICKREADGELYQLFAMQKDFVREDTISFFNEQLQNQNFEDFKDVFLYEDKFYVAMRYYQIPTLNQLLQEENNTFEFEEKLTIGKNVMEAFVLAKMPAFFRCQCLKPEQLLLTKSLESHFRYCLDDVECAAALTMQDYWNGLAEFFEMLWSQELKNKTIPRMQEYIGLLRYGENKTEEQVYRQYLELAFDLTAIPREERNKPRRTLFLIWDRLKCGIPVVKKIIACLILLAVIAYLIYTIWNSMQPHGQSSQAIRYIGTLNVRESLQE